jgi:hypothetical protein
MYKILKVFKAVSSGETEAMVAFLSNKVFGTLNQRLGKPWVCRKL